jgi:hypothetical protein
VCGLGYFLKTSFAMVIADIAFGRPEEKARWLKKRQDEYRGGMPYPHVTPQSDGAGAIDRWRDEVPSSGRTKSQWTFSAADPVVKP